MLIKPSRKSLRAHLQKIRSIVRSNDTAAQGNLIRQLNLVIRGWANYHRHVVAKETFGYVDYRVWKLLWRWSCRRHKNRYKRWVRRKYFHTVGSERWVFQSVDADGKPRRLLLSKSTPIKRHIKIKAEANPYDRNYELYFEQRLIKSWKEKKLHRGKLRMIWTRQKHRCLICKQLFKDHNDWDIHHVVRRTDGGGDEIDNLVMLHVNCHRQLHSLQGDM